MPELADFCLVDVFDGAAIRQVASAHVDPGRAEMAQRVWQRYSGHIAAEGHYERARRSGKPIVVILPDLGERYLSTKLFPE